jgi:hypothetical protein
MDAHWCCGQLRTTDYDMTQQHRLLYGLALALALLTTGLFTARAVHRFSEIRSRVGGPPIRPWMSVPHIAHAYGVPPHLLFEALQIPPDQGKPRPIGAIARSQQRSVDQVIDELRLVIERYHQTPLPAEPPTPPAPPESRTIPVPAARRR